MKFNIRGENIEVTFAIREYVEKKVSKLEPHLIKKDYKRRDGRYGLIESR